MYQTNLIENNTTQTIEEQCQKAFESKQVLSSLDTELKNKVLNLLKKTCLQTLWIFLQQIKKILKMD